MTSVGARKIHGKAPSLELSEKKEFQVKGKIKKFRRFLIFLLRLCTKIEKSGGIFLASIIGLIATHVCTSF